MLSGNMMFEFCFLHLLTTFCALKQSLRAVGFVSFQVTFFNFCTAVVWTVYLKLIDDLLQTHVSLELVRKYFLTIWTFSLVELLKAAFADDGSASITIIW